MPIRTHNMQGGPTGALIDLGGFFKQLEISSPGAGVAFIRAARVKPGASAPATPAATPDVAAGSSLADGWIPLGSKDAFEFRVDITGETGYRWVEIWSTTAGPLVMDAE